MIHEPAKQHRTVKELDVELEIFSKYRYSFSKAMLEDLRLITIGNKTDFYKLST